MRSCSQTASASPRRSWGSTSTDIAESVTDSVVFLASLGPLTKSIKLCTGTVNLPNGHPASIATKVAMLDDILEGRFVFGIGPGRLPSDWEVFGNLELDRREKFLECIEHVLAIVGTAPYDLEGRHWSISTERTMIPEIGQGMMVRPFQKPHPPIALTMVEPHSKSAAEAAVRGWDMISANFLLPQSVRSHSDIYAGRGPGGAWTGSSALEGGEDRAGRRRRSHSTGVRIRPAEPVPPLLRPARLQAVHPATPTCSGRSGATGLGGHDGHDRRPARHRRDGEPGGRGAAAFREEVGDFGTLL